jgi:hypothetical protein
MSELLTFLDHVWGPRKSAKFLATKQKPITGAEDEKLWKVGKAIEWPTHKEIIEQAIIAGNASGVDMYYTPAGFKLGATSKHKANVEVSRCLWIDIDGYKESQTTAEEALDRIMKEGLVPPPTYRLSSSPHGQHWYWILDDYYTPDIIEDLNRRLAYYLEADRACWNIDHVFRPPFTHNHKYPEKPAVDIRAFNAQVYTPDQFKDLPTIREQIKEIINFGTIPPVEEVLARYPWNTQHLEVFKNDKKFFWNAEANDYQKRGDAMVRVAYFGAEVGMSDEAIFALLIDMDNRWEKFKDRPDRTRRLVEMLDRVRTKYPSSVFKTEFKQTQEEVRRIYGFKSLLESSVEFKWLIQDLITETSINFITAVPGVGKSRLALQLGMSFVLGSDFLSWKNIGGQKKVAFLSLEMGHPMLKHFIQQLHKLHPDADLDYLEENFILVPQGEPLELSSPDGYNFFKHILETEKPDVMIIDAMGSLSRDDLTAKEGKEINSRLKAAMNEYGTTFMLIHHNRKPNALTADKPPTLADFYGNTYGATDAASILGLWKPPNSSNHELHTLKSRAEKEGRPLLLDGKSRFTFSVKERMDDENDTGISGDGPTPPTFGFGPTTLA